jgi:predicted DCC family thiol-disulfide oxidoreductase YuxK
MESIFYDGTCRFCLATVRRFEPLLARRGFTLVTLQSPGAARLLGVSEDRLLDEMRVRLDDGSVFGGAAAVVEIARRIWWAWPLYALSRVPGAMTPMRAAYRWIARNRYCINGVCEVGR